jgi:hypothetical protein
MPKVHRMTVKPSIEQAQKLVGGYVTVIQLTTVNNVKRMLLVNEEGLPLGLKPNAEATLLAQQSRHGEQYITMPIVGDVILVEGFNRW